MAVDKMELLKRYKELKAQGVEITLMELKKQMDSSPEGEPCYQPPNKDFEGSSIQVSQVSSSPTFVSSFNSEPQPQPKSQPIKEHVQAEQQQSYQQQFEMQTPVSAFMPSTVQSSGLVQSIFPQPQILQPTPEPKYFGNVVDSGIAVQNTEKKKYALIGYPLGHSLSTYIHNAGFASLGLNSTYDILETPPDSLVDRIKFLKSNNYAGFNVTIPLKLPVTLFLNEIDLSADIVGAVNTVVIKPDKTMKGYNTDVIGFRNAIPKDFVLAGKVAGVLGTGGAARAAITALAQSQVRKIKVYTRNIPNCSDLMKFLREKFPMTEFEVFQIERIRDLSDIDILVNTTPIGMQGRAADFTPIEENELRTLPQGALVYDVIYNPKKTVLLKLAQKNGYRTINGVDMFIHQAVGS